jgi:hypothetical protein
MTNTTIRMAVEAVIRTTTMIIHMMVTATLTMSMATATNPTLVRNTRGAFITRTVMVVTK